MPQNYPKNIAFVFAAIALFAVTAVPSLASAATYYVDATLGSDSNNGTSSGTPWQSATPINARTFVAGDQILFKKGETFSNIKITLFDDSGTSGNPIVFDAYGTGANPILNAGSQNRIFDIRNSASYLTIQNLVLRSPSESGIFVFSGTFTGLNFNHLSISGTTTQAIVISTNATSTASTYDNITVSGFTTGINLNGTKSQGDTFSNLTITASTSGMKFGSSVAAGSNITITSSTITGGSGDCLILNNVTTAVIDGVTIQGCGSNGIYILNTASGISIKNSTVTGNTARGIRFDSKPTNAIIATTTVSNNTSDGILMLAGSTGSRFSNLTVGSNGLAGINVTMGGSSDTLTLSGSTFNSNGTVTGSNGVAVAGTGGTVTILNSTADSNTNDGFGFHNGPTINIDHATSTNNGVDGSGSDGDGFSWHETSGGRLTNSYAWGNKKSAVTNIENSSIIAYGNVFGYTTVAGTNALVTLLDAAALSFYNNTLINPSQSGVAMSLQSTGNVTLRNNLIYGFATGISKTTGATSVSEDYSLIAHTATASVSGSGFSLGSHSLTSDPVLADVSGGDYRLLASSPAINAGTDSLCPTTDKNGVSRQGVCDIGAYEYTDSVAPTITLSGAASITQTIGQGFADPGASATDDVDGTVSVTTGGDTVTVGTVGTYRITYTATDTAGNSAVSTRTVNIVLPPSGGGGGSAPVPTGPSGGFAATSTTPIPSGRILTFSFGTDITKIAISTDPSFATATYVNATSSLPWPDTTSTLYVKYCNAFSVCSAAVTIPGTSNQQPAPLMPSTGRSPIFTNALFPGMQGPDVRTLQQLFASDAALYPEAIVNGFYGALTEAAVRRFQAKYGIVTTGTPSTTGYGVVGPLTLAKLNEVFGNLSVSTTTPAMTSVTFPRNLRVRSRGEDVRQLQMYLNVHGFTVSAVGAGSPGFETDFFGPATKAALILFQNAHVADILEPAGLSAGTGYFGTLTRGVMR